MSVIWIVYECILTFLGPQNPLILVFMLAPILFIILFGALKTLRSTESVEDYYKQIVITIIVVVLFTSLMVLSLFIQ